MCTLTKKLVRSDGHWNGVNLVGEGLVDDVSVGKSDLTSLLVDVAHGVLSPVFFEWYSFLSLEWLGVIKLVNSVLVVLSCVGTSRLLSGFGADHCLSCAKHDILELQSLDQISVPNHTSVEGLHIVQALVDLSGFAASLLQEWLIPEHSRVSLHGLLNVGPQVGHPVGAIRVPYLIQISHRLLAGVGVLEWSQVLAWLAILLDRLSGGSTKYNQIQERVGSQSVGTVYRSARILTSAVKTWNNVVIELGISVDALRSPVGWHTAHVVVNSWQDWNWLSGDINTGEDHSSLRDTWKSGGQLLWWQVVELQVNVVLLWAYASALVDLDGHRPRDNVSTGQILGGWRVSLHESLTFAVDEDSSLASAALGDQATSAENTGWVELHKLHVHVGESGSVEHGHSVSGTSVCRSTTLPGSAVTASGEHGVVASESVEATVFHAQSDDSLALAILHNQVQSKVLNKVSGIVEQGSTVESMEETVSGSIGDAAASMGLTTLAELQTLTAKGSLVDLALLGSREWHSVVFELDDCIWSNLAHVLDSVLISEPIGSLHSVVVVVFPAVLFHIAESGVDTALSGHGVRSGWEELSDASGFETGLRQSKSGS